MTSIQWRMPVSILLSCVLMAPAFAERPRGGAIQYDPAKEVTIKGTVQQVLRHSVDGHVQIHLMVQTSGRTVEVHLGPPHILGWRGFRCRPGQPVEIIGAKAKDEPHLLARRITCGTRTLTLRDERGVPVWKNNN